MHRVVCINNQTNIPPTSETAPVWFIFYTYTFTSFNTTFLSTSPSMANKNKTNPGEAASGTRGAKAAKHGHEQDISNSLQAQSKFFFHLLFSHLFTQIKHLKA